MYSSFQSEEPFAAIAKSGNALQRFSTGDKRYGQVRAGVDHAARKSWPYGPAAAVAGETPVDVSADLLTGMWTLRFGMFGCRDSETRGGAVYIQNGRIFGGDSNFAYHGEWALCGTELEASLDIVRHDFDSGLTTLFGTDECQYHVDCIAEAISPDLIEGRIRRPGFPDGRLTMRRLREGAC